jgi:hypothetical protein
MGLLDKEQSDYVRKKIQSWPKWKQEMVNQWGESVRGKPNEVYSPESEEGMERLTERSVKNNMAYLLNVKPDEQEIESPYPNTLKCIMDSFDHLAAYEDTGLTPEQIQAQQHEINKFRTERDMEVSKTNKLYAEIRALTADKDEQAGRIMRMDYLLRRTLPILEATNNQQELIEAIDALLGGGEG